MLEKVIQTLYAVLVTGALSKGGSWGGPLCSPAVDMNTHVTESAFWLAIAAISFVAFKVQGKLRTLVKNINLELAASKQSSLSRGVDLILCTIHFAMFAHIIYFKCNIMSLINMIQPCHMILLVQGIALYSTSSNGVLITIFVLPALTGTLSAMLFPAVDGLDQPFEMQSYWIQHYIIQAVPLYLLARRNFLALKFANSFSIFMGVWILLVLHFSLYEVVDVSLGVNVEFMLCPTEAMLPIFASVPQWVLWPSYRTTLTLAVMAIAPPLSYSYILVGRVLRMAFGKTQVKPASKTK